MKRNKKYESLDQKQRKKQRFLVISDDSWETRLFTSTTLVILAGRLCSLCWRWRLAGHSCRAFQVRLSVIRKVKKLTVVAVWLNFWSNANTNGEYGKTGYYLGIYAALQVLGVFWFAVLIW